MVHFAHSSSVRFVLILSLSQLFGMMLNGGVVDQMVYFDRKWSLKNTILLFVGYCIVGGGFEVGMYFAAKVCSNDFPLSISIRREY